MENPSPKASRAPHNEPRDLQTRLYREIGISAVAAALETSGFRDRTTKVEPRPRPARAA